MARGHKTSQVGDFLRNFNMVYGTVKDVAQDFEVKKVAEAKPEESTGFTAEQGAELEKLAGQGYKIDFDQGQNAYVAKNEAGDTKTVGMGTVTDFMGQRTAGAMSQSQQDNARMLGMADVIGKNDPMRGMQMRQHVKQGQHAEKRQEREEKAWAREDDLGAIDAELGKKFQTSLVGPDGKARAATSDDYLANMHEKIGRYQAGGHSKEADKALMEYHSMANIKLQLEGKERENAITKTVARLDAGDASGVVDFYNKYLPTGDKLTGVELAKDGKVLFSRVDSSGAEMPPMTLGTVAQLRDGILKSADYRFAYQMSQDQFRNNLALRGDARADRADNRAERADGRAAAAHANSMANSRRAEAERQEKRGVIGALAAEQNPNLTPTQRKAYELGVLDLPKPGGDGKYKADPGMVRKAFEKTVTGVDGQPAQVADPEREKRFYQFAADNDIRDVNEAVVRFNRHEVAQERGANARASQVKAATDQVTANATAQDFADAAAARPGWGPRDVAEKLVAAGHMDEKRANALAKEAEQLLKQERKKQRNTDSPAAPAPRTTGMRDFYSQEAVAQRTGAGKDAAARQQAEQEAERQRQEQEAQQRMQGIGQAFRDAYQR